MLSLIHPKLQIRDFPIQFTIKFKKGLLLVKKKAINQKAKPFALAKHVNFFGI
jgi:hypothetical protein